MWPLGWPGAVTPLWQVLQVPGVTPAWLKLLGTQALVRWQTSHEAVVMTWFAGLPDATVPLWQEKQVPGATLTCEKRAPAQLMAERWQLSQRSAVGMCRIGMTVAAKEVSCNSAD